MLTEQVNKMQDTLNEAHTNEENLDRELNTQREIMAQMEQTKKDYIDRLKKELDAIDARFLKNLNQSYMVGEDHRS